MSVLYLLRYFPTLTETFVSHELRGLLAAGEELRVARLGTRSDGALAPPVAGLRVLEVPRRPLAGLLGRASPGEAWLARHQRPKDVRRLTWLRGQLAGVERIHVHFAGEAAEWAHALHLDTGLPYTVMVHAVDLFKPRPSLLEVLGEAEVVLTVAEHHRRRLAELGVASRLLRCGPELASWAALPAPEAGPLRALFVGRDVPKKGLDLLLAAWEQLQGEGGLPEGSRLDLVGPDRGELPPGIHAHGLRPPNVVQSFMGGADLVLLPCRRAPDGDLDGVPVVLMEALAAGRPVVSTAVSGVPELVDEAVGWLVPPDDVAALAAAIRAALDPAERSRRGARGPQRLRERGFTLGQQVSGLRTAWGRP